MTTTDQVKAAVARVDADPNAGTRKRSHTLQTRRVAAALRAIGLKRSDFSARVTYERDGGGRVYGNAIGSPHTREAAQAIADNAQALADARFRVFLVGDRSHFIASGGSGIRDLRVGS
jgi:uncharacterized membrane protein